MEMRGQLQGRAALLPPSRVENKDKRVKQIIFWDGMSPCLREKSQPDKVIF